jgi:hypothetical protein
VTAALRPALIALLCLASPALADAPAARSFTSPEQAVEALVTAARADRASDLVRILGPAGRALVISGDPVADKAGRTHFVQQFDQGNKLDRDGEGRAVLEIGDAAWPFPIPLVRRADGWQFDTAAGEQEILDRRIGRNELNAIQVCRAYAGAQQEFAEMKAGRHQLIEYAQKFESSPGKHDGLFWPAEAGAPESPLGPQMVSARAEGYDTATGERTPYQGYFYKILTRQGGAAPGGAYDYLAKGHMIGGFALVAFPARWADSGVMSFLINQDGVIYEKNLGPDSAAAARAMTEFNPDESWRKVAAAP